MVNNQLINFAKRHRFCKSGVRWLQRNKLTPRQAWLECTRPGWLLWALYRLDLSPEVESSLEFFAGKAARKAGWMYGYDDNVNRKVCNAIRKAVPWSKVKQVWEKVNEANHK